MEQDVYYKGYKIKIRESEISDSPDEDGDEDIFLVYDHRSFTIKRKGFEPKALYEFLATDEPELWEGHRYHEYWIFPVEAYIHSGVSLSLFTGTKQCRWDSSVSGYILVKKQLIEEYPNINSEQDKKDQAVELAEGLIKTWNQYLSGEVYGFIIEKPSTYYTITKEDLDKILDGNNYVDIDEFCNNSTEEVDWEEIDSCWGYYGDPEESGLLDEARTVIDDLTKNNG